MRLNQVDLNLFVVFETIYAKRNLTRAAEVLCISQPAVSNALLRMRKTFNDLETAMGQHKAIIGSQLRAHGHWQQWLVVSSVQKRGSARTQHLPNISTEQATCSCSQ